MGKNTDKVRNPIKLKLDILELSELSDVSNNFNKYLLW